MLIAPSMSLNMPATTGICCSQWNSLWAVCRSNVPRWKYQRDRIGQFSLKSAALRQPTANCPRPTVFNSVDNQRLSHGASHSKRRSFALLQGDNTHSETSRQSGDTRGLAVPQNQPSELRAGAIHADQRVLRQTKSLNPHALH